MASSNPLPAETDDDEGVFEVDGVFDADEVLRQELEHAGTCYSRNEPNYFCILCRTRYPKKEIVRSHLIPYSVLDSAGIELHAINAAGQEVGLRRHGYRGYCRRCEEMLSSKGEQNFNKLMHKPLVRDNNSAVRVEGDEVGKVYHCAISIWWRLASIHSKSACEKSHKGKEYRKLLERVRVWLHKPRGSLPLGLQVIFFAFHPDDISYMKRYDLHHAATEVYAGVRGGDGDVTRVQMGPLHCLYMFCRLFVDISRSMHIDKGNARLLRIPKENMKEHMQNIKEQMLQLEARAKNRKRRSSEPPVKVSSLDLIPPGTAVITYEKVEFPHHHYIRTAICASYLGNIRIDLYKPTQQEDKPPYEGLAFISTKGGGCVRVWLQSDPTGNKFAIHKDAPVECLAEETLEELEKSVETLCVKHVCTRC